MNNPARAPGTIAPPDALNHPIASLSAAQAVQRIRACMTFARAIAEMVELQIREAAWVVRRNHPERGDFERFVRDQGIEDTMTPEKAWRLAAEWEIVRENRSLRELASDRPREAIHLLVTYADARGDDPVDEIDAEVQGINAKPKRERARAQREVVMQARAAREDRNPADVEQIRTLTEERDAAIHELHKARGEAGDGGADAFVLYGNLIEVQRRLLELAQEAEAWVATHVGGRESAAMRRHAEQALEVADAIAEHAGRIQEALSGPAD